MKKPKSSLPNLSLDPTDIPNLRLLSSTTALQNYLYTTLSHNSEGLLYPPTHIARRQTNWAKKYLQVRPSTFTGGGNGLFTTITLPENTLLGFYGGILTRSPPSNSYVFELSRHKPKYCTMVDASAHLSTRGYLGYINEYIWTLNHYDPHALQNCRFSSDGTGAVYTTTDIQAGSELTIYLGPDYDWLDLKHSITQSYLATYPSTDQPSYNDVLSMVSSDTTSAWHFRRLNKPPLRLNLIFACNVLIYQ